MSKLLRISIRIAILLLFIYSVISLDAGKYKII